MDSGRKIYTKTGDKGETSLLGGTRVPKNHLQVEAYGTIDELNSFIGLIRDQEIDSHYKAILQKIQVNLFVAEAWVAADEEHVHKNLPELNDESIHQLELEIDEMNKSLPELTHFIIPGGQTTVSFCHIARTVCRRAERCVISIPSPRAEHVIVIRYLNRLSDYLFVLARKVAMDAGVGDNLWIPSS